MTPEYGYLQHGQSPGPFLTEAVRIKHLYADQWQAWYEGKWRTVFVQVNRTYIRVKGERITIQIEGV